MTNFTIKLFFMSKKILIVAACLFSLNSIAQSKQETISSIQNILAKANGNTDRIKVETDEISFKIENSKFAVVDLNKDLIQLSNRKIWASGLIEDYNQVYKLSDITSLKDDGLNHISNVTTVVAVLKKKSGSETILANGIKEDKQISNSIFFCLKTDLVKLKEAIAHLKAFYFKLGNYTLDNKEN